ncbi:CoA pyrophosphatase [Clostridium carnis]
MIEKYIKKFENFTPYINGWEKMKRASVAILLTEYNGVESIIFQVRSKKMRSQPGDISFPGGKIDANESAKEAVIREIYEELGLKDNDFEIISELDLFITHYGLLIHPFVGYVKNFNLINVNEDEVDHIFYVPIYKLKNIDPIIINNEIVIIRNESFPYNLIHQGKDYNFKNGIYPSLFYIFENYVIWGITAKILENFMKLL